MNQHQWLTATQLCTAHSLIPSFSYKNVRRSHLCIILCLEVITSLLHFLTHCLITSCLNLIFSKGQKPLFHHAHHFKFSLICPSDRVTEVPSGYQSFLLPCIYKLLPSSPQLKIQKVNFIWHSGPIAVICCHHGTEQAAINSMSARNYINFIKTSCYVFQGSFKLFSTITTE
jgi:hypothetical protein